jgi:hypothetical protein
MYINLTLKEKERKRENIDVLAFLIVCAIKYERVIVCLFIRRWLLFFHYNIALLLDSGKYIYFICNVESFSPFVAPFIMLIVI